MNDRTPAWLVLNQSLSPAFQDLLGRLAERLGPCVLHTGMPHEHPRVGLTLSRGPRYERRSVRTRFGSWLRFLASAALRVARTPGRPFLLAVTNPPFLPHLAWLFRRVRGHRYALLIWDVYPDHLVQMRLAGGRNPFVRAWTSLNRRAMLGAEVTIAIGDGMAGALRRQLGESAARCRIEVIPNWADVASIRPGPKETNPFAVEHGQVGKVTVMYSGNLGATHGVQAIAGAAAVLRDEPEVEFLVVGEGLGRAALQDEIRRRRLSNLKLLDFQPWSRLPLSLATADIAIVMQVSGTETLSVPSKTYSCLAAGSAILAMTSAESDLGRLVRTNDVGVVVPPDDAEAAARAIRELVGDPERLGRYRANARRAAEEQFSAEAVLKRFLEVLTAAGVGAGIGAEGRP